MFDDEQKNESVSPLLMITKEPVLNEFMRYLIDIKNQIELNQKNYNADIKLIFNRDRITEVKESLNIFLETNMSHIALTRVENSLYVFAIKKPINL